jgi:peptidoglycan L-alanyl-D-glutamate endopeptidase CwlK
MSFFTDVIQRDPRAASTTAIRDLDLLEPVTRAAVLGIVADAAVMNITLLVTETYRSKERQAYLFSTHATQLRDVGVHYYGLAADFCKIVEGKASWDGDWKFLGDLAKKHGLVWGGDWGAPDKPHTFCDMDHVQRCTVAQQPELFAGAWYPADSV